MFWSERNPIQEKYQNLKGAQFTEQFVVCNEQVSGAFSPKNYYVVLPKQAIPADVFKQIKAHRLFLLGKAKLLAKLLDLTCIHFGTFVH